MRTRPARSVTKSRPSGARSTAHGATRPLATSCTFSTTAGPTRGDGVGVGLALEGGGVVGMATVVVCGDDVMRGGGPAHADARTTKANANAARLTPGPRATPQDRLTASAGR